MASSSTWMRFMGSVLGGATWPPHLSVRNPDVICPTGPDFFSFSSRTGLGRTVPAHRQAEPAPGVGPIVVGGRRGDAEGLRRLRAGQAREEAELDQFGLPLVLGL